MQIPNILKYAQKGKPNKLTSLKVSRNSKLLPVGLKKAMAISTKAFRNSNAQWKSRMLCRKRLDLAENKVKEIKERFGEGEE